MKMTGAEIIIALLERQGITTIAGIPGGTNLPLYDALAKSRIRHILARHEQGAGFIAQGMARSTGIAAVCFATSGPGATNLLTAIADAKLDSVPLVAITGQVARSLIGTDAFQEIDTYGMTIPITKHNFLVRSAGELLSVMPEAFRIASSGRPGPVLIDVPKDVQCETAEFSAWPEPGRPDERHAVPAADIERIAALINGARRPLIYFGGGIIHGEAHRALFALMRKNTIPAASTLLGLGCLTPGHPLNLGMIGMHGSRATNRLVQEADLLLAFGARFDDRATGDIAKFCPDAAVVHVDIDRSELGKLKRPACAAAGDIGLFLEQLLPLVREDAREAWRARIRQVRERYGESRAEPYPRRLIAALARAAGDDAIITTDVGQHQMWVAQSYPFTRPRQLLTSGGLGTMGFGLPAAIGAALANPGRRVLCLSGDGSLLMNVQELATLADLGLDVTVVVFDNGHLGLVRQQQELFYDGNYIASRFASRTDFAALAAAFGIRSRDLARGADPAEALNEAFAQGGPCLIRAEIEGSENVLPMVPPGAAITEAIERREHHG